MKFYSSSNVKKYSVDVVCFGAYEMVYIYSKTIAIHEKSPLLQFEEPFLFEAKKFFTFSFCILTLLT